MRMRIRIGFSGSAWFIVLGAMFLVNSMRACAEHPGQRSLGSGNSEIAALLEPIREKYNLPALAAAIVDKKGVTTSAAVGNRVREVGPAITVDDKFHLGSCTKAMTATLLATFVEEGKLTWETTIAEALPDLAEGMRPEYRNVTVAQLLAHRAGLSAETAAPGLSLNAMRKLNAPFDQARLDYVRRVLEEPPENPPGSKFKYANRGYIIAGAIAERFGGAPWEELMERRVFRPLGMESAGFGGQATPGHDDPSQADQPWPHARLFGEVVIPIQPGPGADNPLLIGPAGTVHASMADWGRFLACHLREGEGEPALLKPETFATLHQRPTEGDYAFGWNFTDRNWAGGKTLVHSGSNTMNYAVVWMAPERDRAFLAVTNIGGQEAAKACDQAVSALIRWEAGAGRKVIEKGPAE